MKKNVAIVTLYGNNNYGNKLQNFALQEIIRRYNINVVTIKNTTDLCNKDLFVIRLIYYYIKLFIHKIILNDDKYTDNEFNKNIQRTNSFLRFDKKINKTKKYFNYFRCLKYNFDIYIVGSDQVWNPDFGLKDFGLLNFIKNNDKKFSYSASIGTSNIPDKLKHKYIHSLKKFKYISVREYKAKELIEQLTGRDDISVLVDPTMLLSTKEWDLISKRPRQINSLKRNKYILNYFLGDISEDKKKEIKRIANENDLEIINLMDKNDPFYTCGPSEFLYLEKNAFLICTDSFHSCVFALLYNRPFVLFERDQQGVSNMNSRIETLFKIFKLKNRIFNGKKITKENLEHDYREAYKILKNEKNKSKLFVERILNIKK